MSRKTVFVKYEKLSSSISGDYTVKKSLVVDVEDLLDLNDMFEGYVITDIQILQ